MVISASWQSTLSLLLIKKVAPVKLTCASKVVAVSGVGVVVVLPFCEGEPVRPLKKPTNTKIQKGEVIIISKTVRIGCLLNQPLKSCLQYGHLFALNDIVLSQLGHFLISCLTVCCAVIDPIIID